MRSLIRSRPALPTLPTYNDANRALKVFLALYSSDIGLKTLFYGMQQWLLFHYQSESCWSWKIPGEALSERSLEFTESFLLLMESLGILTHSVDDAEANEFSFSWLMRAHFSDKYVCRVAKIISNTVDLRNMKRYLGSLTKLTEKQRINADGRADDWGNYAYNALSCPIL